MSGLISGSLMLTEQCNLHCVYCFEKKAKNKMSEDVALKAIDFFIENAKASGEKKIAPSMFGGEPTLEAGLMQKIFEYGFKRAEEEGLSFEPSIITNGTIFTDEYETLLRTWKQKTGKIDIQLSIDGIPLIQDADRISSVKDTPSSVLVEQALEKYRKLAEELDIKLGNEIHIHSVVSKTSLPHLFDSYLYFRNLGFPGLSYTLVLEDDWNKDDVEIYRTELNKMTEYFVKNKDLGLWKSHKLFSKFRKDHPDKPCGAGCTYCTIAPNGDIYPCHRFYFADKESKMGTIYKGIDPEKVEFYKSITTSKLIGDKKCSECQNKHCKKCIAAFYGENKMPFLGFPKYCKMVDVETEAIKYLYKTLKLNKNTGDYRDINDDYEDENLSAAIISLIEPTITAIDKLLESNKLIGDKINSMEEMLYDTNKALINLSTLTIAILERLTGEELSNEAKETKTV